ncbi:FN3 associated domain-containing protein [Fibrobacterota bacterium]
MLNAQTRIALFPSGGGIFFTLLLMINIIHAQTRCELVSQNCLDMNDVGGASIQIPSNTTRIDNDGVSICLTPAGTEQPPVDIVFVVDQSGSMNTTDNTYYAPTATTLSMDELYSIAPESYGGFVSFAGYVCAELAPITLLNGGDAVLKQFAIDNMATQQSELGCVASGGTSNVYTNYREALNRAGVLITQGPHEKKAIIFVTDGEPCGPSGSCNGSPYMVAYDEWTGKADLPPVYSIYIGGDPADSDSTTSAGRLTHLGNITGGGYYPIPAGDPSALRDMMAAVVEEAVSPGIPSSTTITNNTNGQVSQSANHVEITNGMFQVILDSVVALGAGTNSITVTTQSTKNGVPQAPLTYSFTLDASGPPTPNLGDISLPDSLFDITCVEPSTLLATNTSYTEITTLGYLETMFGIQLESTSGVTDPAVSITASASGDGETVILGATAWDSVYRDLADFLVVAGTGTSNNSVVEGQLGDALYLKWEHPRDSRDSAATTLNIERPTVATPQANPGDGTPIISSLSLTLFTTTPSASIFYTLNGDDPATSAGGSTFLYTGAIDLYIQTTVKAIATRPGWFDSGILEVTYPKTFSQSRLVIYDAAGVSPIDILYADETQYSVKLSTNQAGVPSYQPGAVTTLRGDSETLTMTTSTGAEPGYDIVYQNAFAFDVITGSPSGNSILEAASHDTVIVTWTNPYDGNDVASDTVIVQPVDEQARIYFSTSDSLGDTTSQFSEGDSPLYIIITDQPANPALNYTVTLTTTSAESETLPLTEINGNLVAQVPANYSPISADDDTLQVKLAGDVITASYTDPVYPDDDIKQGSAEYGAKSIADPVISPPDGAFFQTDTAVTITAATTGSSINYTTDGITMPSNLVGTPYAPFNVFLSTIVRAVAYIQHSADNFVMSNVVTARLNSRDQIGIPTADPASTYFTESISIDLIPDLPGDSIYYTLDNSAPDRSALLFNPASPIGLTVSDTIKFLAVNGPKIPSAVIQEIYIKRDTLDAPLITPPSQVFSGNITVTISNPMVTGAIIRYTTDGSHPNDSSAIFTPSSSLNFSLLTTVRAKAFNPIGSDAYVPSVEASETYQPKVATPVADPPDTTFISSLLSRLSTATFGAQIYYTLDGSTPDETKKLYSQAVTVDSTTVLRAVAIRGGWAPSDILEVTYTKANTPSTLQILDANYQEVDSLTELDASFTVVITAAEANLNSVRPVAITLSNGDTDTLTLFSLDQTGGLYRFTAEIPFSVNPGNAGSGNGTVEAGYYDSVIVTWINPNNPGDTASDTVRVRPYSRPAVMYFTETLAAGSPVFTYSTDLDTIFLIVQDQAWRPGLDYTVTLVTDPLYGDRGPDTVTLNLQEITPGTYGVPIPVDKNLVTDASDSLLQALKGDVIYAYYTDPQDLDNSSAQVVYGTAGEVAGTIAFTDAQGNELADDEYWHPDQDSLYLRYVDDYTTKRKTLTITVKNTTGTGTVRYDTLMITLDPPLQQDSLGIWIIALHMDEVEVPDAGNQTVDVFFKGEVTALIPTHSKDGTPLTTLQDQLIVARPDEEERIIISACGADGNIYRSTEEICITVIDQNFTGGVDTILVDVQDTGTTDIIRGLKLIQINDSTYAGSFTKDELPLDKSDTILSTLASDLIRVTYTDPVYRNSEVSEAPFSDVVVQDIYFIDQSGGTRITALNEYDASTFVVVVQASTPDKYAIDTLEVTLTTQGGDAVTVEVVETGPNSGIFESAGIPFAFAQDPQAGNQVIEGNLDLSTLQNNATVSATVVIGENSSSSGLEIGAAYVPADSSWIIDGDQDGRADTIFIKFRTSLPELPQNIFSIDWPADNSKGFTASGDPDESLSEISFLVRDDGSTDSSVLVVVLKDNGEVFDMGQTSASRISPPKLTLPDHPVFQGLEVEIMDRVGPVLVDAYKYATDGGVHVQTVNGEDMLFINPDTLVFTLSEKIHPLADTGSVWDSLLWFVPQNDPSGEAYPIILLEGTRPILVSEDSLTWKIILTTRTDVMKPRNEDNIFLSSDPLFMDEHGNVPSEREVPIEGNRPFAGDWGSYIFSPVEGLDLNAPGSIIALGDFKDGELIIPNADRRPILDDGGQVIGWEPYEQKWIPPQHMNEDGTINEALQAGCDNLDETQQPVDYPENCLSTVVIWTEIPYTAHINIYDHLGKFVHSSVQRFGNCGEMRNAYRRDEDRPGVMSFLVWNQKDSDGTYVGTGVYVWKVIRKNEMGETIESFYRQGIVRSSTPVRNCASEGL